MPPMVHKIPLPIEAATAFANGSQEQFNAYVRHYFKANYPELEEVQINGNAQDFYKQRCIYAAYKSGSSPAEIAEARAAAKKRGKK